MSQIAARHSDRRRSRSRSVPCVLAMSLLAGLVLLSGSPGQACTTPVYRYAMYNWAPAPYFVFYFHRGEPPAEDEQINQMITELAETPPAVANVRFEAVDVSKDDLHRLPEPVAEAWRSHVGPEAEQAEPVYLVFTSWGAKLHVGRLDAETVRAMVSSPVRTRVGELLQGGCAAVMAFLPGSDAAENERAEKVAREVIALAESGQIPVESGFIDAALPQQFPPSESAGEQPSGDAQEETAGAAPASELKVDLVKLARYDAAETWLVRSLAAMEPDLQKLAEQPMIFFCYGRGRAMPPYVGKGITAENLTGEIQFLASACSCLVKEQNPGVDLLMQWDWGAAADAMAANDPTLYGNPFMYEEFSPGGPGEEPAPAAESVTMAKVASADGSLPPEAAVASSPEKIASQVTTTDPPAPGTSSAAQQQQDGSSQPSAAPGPDERVAAVAPQRPESNAGGSFAGKQVWTLGVGLAVITVVVLCAGFMLMLKRA